jgi:hypothetical protein
MKIVTKRRGLLATAILLAAIAAMALAQWASAGTPVGDEVISQAMKSLTEQGVPVKSWSLDGPTLTVALQSASTTDVGTPDDPIHLSQVQREAFLAKSRGLGLTQLRLSVTNAEGKALFAGDIVLDKELDARWSAAATLPDSETVAALRAALTEKTDLSGLALKQFDLTTDAGTRQLVIAAVAADIKAANVSTASFMISLHSALNDLNAQSGAQIALARVDITDEKGEPLLKWIYDVQRGAEDWWQAPGMTTDWFETPGPAASATKAD